MTTSWVYQNKEFTSEDIGDYLGFVYLITNLDNGRKYIGKKIFINVKKKPPLKGKTRRRIERVESDWKSYYGSNEELKELVEKSEDKSRFTREILTLCRTKSEMGYVEAKLHFQYDVLLDETYYNSWISCRINRNQLKVMKNG